MIGLTTAVLSKAFLLCNVLNPMGDAKTDYLSREVLSTCPPSFKVTFTNHAPGGKIDLLAVAADVIVMVTVATASDSVWQLTRNDETLVEWRGNGIVFTKLTKDSVLKLRHMNKQNDWYYVSVLPIAVRGENDDN